MLGLLPRWSSGRLACSLLSDCTCCLQSALFVPSMVVESPNPPSPYRRCPLRATRTRVVVKDPVADEETTVSVGVARFLSAINRGKAGGADKHDTRKRNIQSARQVVHKRKQRLCDSRRAGEVDVRVPFVPSGPAPVDVDLDGGVSRYGRKRVRVSYS
jgi:hypothetical protein